MNASTAPALTIISDNEESFHAFELLRRTFTHEATIFAEHLVGWQGGSKRLTVYWHPSFEIWGVLEAEPPNEKKNSGRFWNCFGINDPARHSMLTITVEMNPPHQGRNRRAAGLFLRDGDGRVFLGHTGKVGGGRKGIGKNAFRTFYGAGDWHEIEKRLFATIFGPIDRPDLPRVLAEFVHAVARFKEQAASGAGR